MAVATASGLTADAYLAVPPDGRRIDLIDGEVVVAEPTVRHQRAVQALNLALGVWSTAQPGRGEVLPPLDVRLDDRNVFAPDLLWYREGRAPAFDAPRPSPMPDLAVEVRSPSTWHFDVGRKKAGYEAHGLAELWLVDLEGGVVLVYRRSRPQAPTFDLSTELGRGATLTSPLLAAFAVAVDAVVGAAPAT